MSSPAGSLAGVAELCWSALTEREEHASEAGGDSTALSLRPSSRAGGVRTTAQGACDSRLSSTGKAGEPTALTHVCSRPWQRHTPGVRTVRLTVLRGRALCDRPRQRMVAARGSQRWPTKTVDSVLPPRYEWRSSFRRQARGDVGGERRAAMLWVPDRVRSCPPDRGSARDS